MTLDVRLRESSLHVGEAWTRIPFRYGNACLTAVPILHARVVLESAAGASAVGVSADCLPPRWFDKSPEKDFRRNVEDLLSAIRTARQAYLEAGGAAEPAASVHRLWERAYPETLRRADALGLNRLSASFGSSLFERAAIDAACRIAGLSFHRALRLGVLGYAAGEELAASPLESIDARHTVGLGDPLRASEIPEAERLDDGLPQALDEAIDAYGLRYFKVKVRGDEAADADRLERIAELLTARCPGGFAVTLDGNEQYRDAEPLLRLLDGLERRDAGRRFVEAVIFIEQPLARELALEPAARRAIALLGAKKPVIIDESDDGLDALDRALALGYRGCSIKNCKGVFKALRFRAEIVRLNRTLGEERFFQSGEDLANLPVAPLQQDLATLAALGIPHAERNGHHYFPGLAHLPARERASALRVHGDLYREFRGGACLRIEDGRIRCASLQAPGYGYACELALDERAPLAEWRFERLRLG